MLSGTSWKGIRKQIRMSRKGRVIRFSAKTLMIFISISSQEKREYQHIRIQHRKVRMGCLQHVSQIQKTTTIIIIIRQITSQSERVCRDNNSLQIVAANSNLTRMLLLLVKLLLFLFQRIKQRIIQTAV